MRADYTIGVPVDPSELEGLREGETYSWIFVTNEDSDVRVRINIQLHTEED
jgi:hypothetical protein